MVLLKGEKMLAEIISIQNELKAPKNRHNKFGNYQYRNAEDILTAVKPLLEKYDCLLTLSDMVTEVGNRVYVIATATIENGSGEKACVHAYAREAESKKGMDESQITGTASSYARKYALNGLFLIDDTKDADTDEYRQEADARAQQEEVKGKLIDAVKVKALEMRCDEEGVDYAKVCAKIGISRFEDMTEWNHRVLSDNWDVIKKQCAVSKDEGTRKN